MVFFDYHLVRRANKFVLCDTVYFLKFINMPSFFSLYKVCSSRDLNLEFSSDETGTRFSNDVTLWTHLIILKFLK